MFAFDLFSSDRERHYTTRCQNKTCRWRADCSIPLTAQRREKINAKLWKKASSCAFQHSAKKKNSQRALKTATSSKFCLQLRLKFFLVRGREHTELKMRTSHKMYLTFILSSACIFLYQYHMSIPRMSSFAQQSINEVSWLFNSPNGIINYRDVDENFHYCIASIAWNYI